MSEKININEKGDTNVKSEEEFDIRKAGIERSKKADWDDFELMGGSNKEEGEYVAPPEADPAKMNAELRRAKAKIVGLGVLQAINMA